MVKYLYCWVFTYSLFSEVQPISPLIIIIAIALFWKLTIVMMKLVEITNLRFCDSGNSAIFFFFLLTYNPHSPLIFLNVALNVQALKADDFNKTWFSYISDIQYLSTVFDVKFSSQGSQTVLLSFLAWNIPVIYFYFVEILSKLILVKILSRF